MAALSVAVLVKFSAALVAPLLMVAVLRAQQGWRQRVKVLAAAGALALGMVLLAYLPFWPPWESLAGVLDEFSHRYTYSIAALLRLVLREFIPADLAYGIPRAAGQVVFAVLYVGAMVRLWQRRIGLPLLLPLRLPRPALSSPAL